MAMEITAAAAKREAREYELVYILQPNVDPDEGEKIATRIQDITTRLGGKITKVDQWGRKRLSYPIRKFSRGVFIYLEFVGFNDLVAEIERNLRNFDSILRFQTVRRAVVADVAAVTVDPEEVKFSRIEVAAPEPEQTREEKLGLIIRQRPVDDYDMHGDDDLDIEVPDLNPDLVQN